MKRNQQGFTLIELMIVVAIIGILAAIAVPAFQKNIQKSKFAEALSVSDGYKGSVGLCMSTNVNTDCDAGANGIPAVPAALPTNIASMTVADGVITVTATAAADSRTSVLTPTLDNGIVKWAQTGTCATTEPKYC